ncbi:MAG: carbohydrate kinase family protein [Candidatus Moranbacteria bacterium]|nr:carbohydrate kinase family protein [Candidatus Moranbacteria bacterium]
MRTPEDITSKEKLAFELGGKIACKNRYEAVGGVAANVSVGLARLGHTGACYSNIGNDETGRWAKQVLKNERVRTELLFCDESAKTDLSAIVVMTQNGERTIFHNRDANEKLKIRDDAFAQTQWIFVSALNGDWENNLGKLLSLKEMRGFSLAFNPGQHNIKTNPKRVLEAITKTDILLLNKDEAIELISRLQEGVPKESLDDEIFLVQALIRVGAKVVGMTDGKRGSWAYDGKECWYCPIYTVDGVVDSTGCGDAFGSGFFSAILRGKTLDEALRYGMANSGSVVGEYGAIEGLLHTEKMETIIARITPERLN